MLTVYRDHPLGGLNTFHIDAAASLFIETDSQDELLQYMRAEKIQEPFLILGGGSNILLAGDFPGTILHPLNQEADVTSEDPEHVFVTAGAGTSWDFFVEWCVNQSLGGLENLSLIPGTVGAAPVQNIGAYGTEAGAWIHTVEVIDLNRQRVFNLPASECRFGYRDSLFKQKQTERWLVWSVTFRLLRHPEVNLSYEQLRRMFAGPVKPTLNEVRQAVISIRRSKLPDPAVTGNAGSFFKNPVVPLSTAIALQHDYPQMTIYPAGDQTVKIPAGWLIEQCGWKGFREGPVGVYPAQALVLVNYGGGTAAQIMALAERIRSSVQERFGIHLENEVLIL